MVKSGLLVRKSLCSFGRDKGFLVLAGRRCGRPILHCSLYTPERFRKPSKPLVKELTKNRKDL